jgi:hypothetical protein
MSHSVLMPVGFWRSGGLAKLGRITSVLPTKRGTPRNPLKTIYTVNFMYMKVVTTLAVFFTTAAQLCCGQGAGLTQLSSTSLKLHPDSFYLFNWEHYRRGPLFDMAIGPTGDFFALVGMQDSRWQLFRVKDWSTAKPIVDRVTVPGFGSADEANRWGLTPKVRISPDGNFAVAIASASWPTSGQRLDAASQQPDALLTVVDLRTFKAVKTLRASERGLRTWNWRFDETGTLRGDGLNPAGATQPVGTENWVALLSIPDLQVLERCDYSEVVQSGKLNFVPHEPVSRLCTAAAQASDDLMNMRRRGDLKARLDASCGIDRISQDERYALSSCREGHDVIWGYSWGPESTSVYSVATGQAIATLQHKRHRLTDTLLATVDGKDYLFVFENAEILTVYQIETSTHNGESPTKPHSEDH